ncbi:unnamed protein product [Brassica rapa]|uniref:Uncharacterized protein n=1 Tax=Brassica campestris TaxID=3711 RepID=A0A8D9HL36_BRACM|nr:unnamed protein product [Brassica rapa]
MDKTRADLHSRIIATLQSVDFHFKAHPETKSSQSQILVAFSKGVEKVESKARMSIPLSEFIQYRVRKLP